MSSPTTFELSMSLFWRLMKSGPFDGTSAAGVFGAFAVSAPAAGGFMVGFILVLASVAFWAIAVALARAPVAAAASKNVRMGSTPLGLSPPETLMRWESSVPGRAATPCDATSAPAEHLVGANQRHRRCGGGEGQPHSPCRTADA